MTHDHQMTIHQSQCYLDILWIFMKGCRSNTRQDPRVLAVDRWLIRAEFYDDCFQAAARTRWTRWTSVVLGPEAVDICGYIFFQG